MKGLKKKVLALFVSMMMVTSMFGSVMVNAEKIVPTSETGVMKDGTQKVKVNLGDTYYYKYTPEKTAKKNFKASLQEKDYMVAVGIFDENQNMINCSNDTKEVSQTVGLFEKGKEYYVGFYTSNSSYGLPMEEGSEVPKQIEVTLSLSDAASSVVVYEGIRDSYYDYSCVAESNVKGLSWNPATATLTMDGYNAENSYIYFKNMDLFRTYYEYNGEPSNYSAYDIGEEPVIGIPIEGEPPREVYSGEYYTVTIVVKGKNTLKDSSISADPGVNLVFKGDGELTIDNDKYENAVLSCATPGYYGYGGMDCNNKLTIDGPRISISGAFSEDVMAVPYFEMRSGTLYMEIRPCVKDGKGHYGDIYAWKAFTISGGSIIVKYVGLPEGTDYQGGDGYVSYQMVESPKITAENATIIVTGDADVVEKVGNLYVFGDGPGTQGKPEIADSVIFLKGSSIDISKLKVSLSETSYIYDGKAKTPDVFVEGLKEGEDFEVTYKNNVKVGKATVIVTGKGFFKGTITATFDIVKAKPVADGPKEGTTVKDSDYVYKVTKAGSTNGKIIGEVKLVKLKNKKLKSVKVANVVTINKVKYKVTAIGNKAFKKNKNITKVVIGKNVKTIGNSAFEGCKKLKLVNIKSKKLTKIGKKAFAKCKKLKKIIIKSTKLKKIGNGAVKGTSKKLVVKAPKNKKASYEDKFKKAGNKKVKVK